MKGKRLIINPFSNKPSYAQIILSYFAFRPVLNMVTICAQNLKVVCRIVSSVSINMVNNKTGLFFVPTFIARWGTIFFYRFCKTYYRILNFCFNRTVRYRRASSGAKSSFAALISFSSCYYFPTNLARLPLVTRKRTINSVLVSSANVANFKTISACCAFFLGNSSNVSAFFGAIYLPNALSDVVSFELFLANRACIHNGGHYAFA